MYQHSKEITSERIIKDIKKKVSYLHKNDEYLNQKNLEELKKDNYYVCIHSMGHRCYLYITTYNENKCCILLEKNKMYLCSLSFQPDIYDGTLLEGEMVKNKRDEYIFIINDIYEYKGDTISDLKFEFRKDFLNMFIEDDYLNNTELLSSFYLSVKQYFSKEYIYDIVDKYIPSLSFRCSGLLFKSNNTYERVNNTFDYIYIFPEFKTKYKNNVSITDNEMKESNEPIKLKELNEPIKLKESNEEIKIKELKKIKEKNEIIESNENTVSYLIKNTSIPEIYELYLTNGKEKEKISYASVPNIETSLFLKNIFKENKGNEDIYVNCYYHEKFKKWIPYEKSNQIDTIDKLYWVQSIIMSNYIEKK